MFRVKNILYGVGILLLAAAVVSLVAPPVIAQVRAALVRDVDHPARSSFLYKADVDIAAVGSGTSVLTAVIPAGKKLVLEFVGVSCTSGVDDRLLFFLRMRQPDGSLGSNIRLPVDSETVPPLRSWVAVHSVRLYADQHAEGSVEVSVARIFPSATNVACDFNLSGFTVDSQ